MAKAEITEKGVFNGEGQEAEIGAIIEFKGDDLPSVLKGKARLIAAKAKQADKMVVNLAQKEG